MVPGPLQHTRLLLACSRTTMRETCTTTERHDSCRMWSLGHPLVVCRAYVVTRQEFGSRCSDIRWTGTRRARTRPRSARNFRWSWRAEHQHQSRAHNLGIVSKDTNFAIAPYPTGQEGTDGRTKKKNDVAPYETSRDTSGSLVG